MPDAWRGWGKVWQILVEHIPFRISPLMTLALPSYVPINFSHLLLVWLGSEVRCGEYLLSISHSEYLLWWPSPWLAFPHMFWPFNLLTFYWLGRAVRQGVANACWEYLVQNISFDGPHPTIISSYVPFIDPPTDRLTGQVIMPQGIKLNIWNVFGLIKIQTYGYSWKFQLETVHKM